MIDLTDYVSRKERIDRKDEVAFANFASFAARMELRQ